MRLAFLQFRNLRIMGEEHSKASSQKQTIDCSSASSLGSNSEKVQLQPISCSPQKFKQISRSKKIKTTCVLKTLESKQETSINCKRKLQNQQFLNFLVTVAEVLQLKLETAPPIAQDIDPQIKNCQNISRQPDVDRIDSLFQFSEANLNLDQFRQGLVNNHISIQNWKHSTNKIIYDTTRIYSYRQGYLLICSIIRLFFSEAITFNFLSQLLKKIEGLLCSVDQYNYFSQNLQKKCIQKFPYLNSRLAQNDLDFQFIYTGWVFGMFSTILPKKLCLKIWYKILASQNPTFQLEEIIFACLSSIQQNLFGKIRNLSQNEQNEQMLSSFQLTNQNLQNLIDTKKIQETLK